MKKTVILIIVSLAMFASDAFAAKPDSKKITTENERIEHNADSVYIDFDVVAGKRAARSGHTVIYRPYLVNGEHRWDMPEVVIRKSRASIVEQRHEWVSGEEVVFDNPTVICNGDRYYYSIAIPRQGWMDGANLEAEITDRNCCTSDTGSDMIVENIELPAPMMVVDVWVPDTTVMEEATQPKTTGDLFAEETTFVLPVAEFENTVPALMFDDDREGALKVHFAVGSHLLDPNRSNNARTLSELLTAIRKLEASPDSRVSHVVIAGFTSPEGSFSANDRLAWNRALKLKQYILDNSNIDNEVIHIYNGVEDWFGLRMLVEESNLSNKQAILHIIDTVPIWDASGKTGREIELRKLDGGRTYRYMSQHFFPELRAAAYIKVYYKNR